MPGVANSNIAPKINNFRTPQNNTVGILQPLQIQNKQKKDIQNILTTHD
jgi:hypothetical protein